ncbi:MAG: RagB/SusD family nutrient uptake outer membrane protein [Bacteroidota bacterium]
MSKTYVLFSFLLLILSCQSISDIDELTPDEARILSSGADLQAALHDGYATWWQATHGTFPNLALLVAGDAYGLSRGDFGTVEMGIQPRQAFDNRVGNAINEVPWYGLLNAANTATDVLSSLERGISIDKGAAQDQSIRAAAHLLRGLSWGYMSSLFDQGVIVDETTDLNGDLPLISYQKVLENALSELDAVIDIGNTENALSHTYFNRVLLNSDQLSQLVHAYKARFLVYSARTFSENEQTDWAAVLYHAERGLEVDFAPLADGDKWQSYQAYTFAETGKGPFWARLDQRLVAAFDPSQPVNYPQVSSENEAPLNSPQAQSADARLNGDFIYEARINFNPELGEWHFSHYKHHRNKTQDNFAGNGQDEGTMPTFLAADNVLLKAEAAYHLGALEEAATLLNSGSRVARGNLSSVASQAEAIFDAIRYERSVELLSTAPFGLWLDRRRWQERENMESLTALGGLLIGTAAQLPVPAKELNGRKMDVYTFGGIDDPQGILPIPQ